MTSALPESVRPVVARLASTPGVRRVVLFGSRARGDHHDRSDVDLALEAPGVSRSEWARLSVDVEDARTLYRIDVVRLEDAPDELRDRIEDEGVDLEVHG